MSWQNSSGPSRTRWAFLLAVLIAAVLRFYRLGSAPPGLYRDEAFNGLDALGVLNGDLAIFFTANNGREPGYIYLTALAVALFGRSPLAVRFGAALVGTVTTAVTYKLGKTWFGERVGIYGAWLWAITLWPVHLSRIGLRPILLPLLLGLTFWIGTVAYRERSARLWLAAGALYGLSFYTYLAVRLTPLLLLLVLLYLWWRKRSLPSTKQLALFGGAALAVLLPLLLWLAQNPNQFLGRTGQVSILNPTINGGNLIGALWAQTWRGLGLFVWRGDTILRHNPTGRPVFDWVMALPFLLGVGVCLWRWKRPPYAILLLWTLTMLAPTILAEDTPHFLRAVGILPATILLPALGLHQFDQLLHSNPITKQPLVASSRHLVTPSLITLSLLFTVNDYAQYTRNPSVALLFEAAALDLARQIDAELENTAVYVDRWFWDGESAGWPTVPFITDLERVMLYRPEFGTPPPAPGQPVAIYGWPFGSLDFVPGLVAPPSLVNISSGPLARGDLEPDAYPLYVRYATAPLPNWEPIAQIGEQFTLHHAEASLDGNDVSVSLYWSAESAVMQEWKTFVHLNLSNAEFIQSDHTITSGLWLNPWWQPGLIIEDRHQLSATNPNRLPLSDITIGVYDPLNGERLPILALSGEQMGDAINFGWEELEKK